MTRAVDVPVGTSANKVLLIDIDGVRWDKLCAVDTPNMDALAAGGQFGVSYIHGTDVAFTDSGPGHANLLTGVWPDKHKVVDNAFAGNDIARFPDVITRAKRLRPELSTFSTLDWQPLNDFLIDKPDVKLQQHNDGTPEGIAASDQRSVDAAVEAITAHDPDLVFVYVHRVDGNGHANGSESTHYTDAIAGADALVGELVAAVRSRPSYAQEDWLILVVTDHGFAANFHGTNAHTIREAWLLAHGGDVPATGTATRQWRQVDVTPTVLGHLGIEIDPAWDLDGIAIGTPSNDPFDELYPKLVDGWTMVTPAGWTSADRCEPGTGGAYRGWWFTTGAHWVEAGADAGRESFFRGRDVIAVADADAWGRIDQGQRFDATLTSSWLDVAPGERVEVSYLSHLNLPAGADARASLVLTFDDGTEQPLWTGDTAAGERFDISRPQAFTAVVPPGARRVRAVWRLDDTGRPGERAYWAVDAPALRTLNS